MSAAISCSWEAVQGAEEADVSIFHAPRGTDQMPCEICVQRGALPVSGIEVISNAGACEVYEQSHSTGRPSYVSTIRGKESEQKETFLIHADIQAVCSRRAARIVLRMLSLTETGVFCMHSLDVREDEPTAREPGVSRPSSQIEAVRQILQEQGGNGEISDPRQKLMASIAQAALRQNVAPSMPPFGALPDSLELQFLQLQQNDLLSRNSGPDAQPGNSRAALPLPHIEASRDSTAGDTIHRSNTPPSRQRQPESDPNGAAEDAAIDSLMEGCRRRIESRIDRALLEMKAQIGLIVQEELRCLRTELRRQVATGSRTQPSQLSLSSPNLSNAR